MPDSFKEFINIYKLFFDFYSVKALVSIKLKLDFQMERNWVRIVKGLVGASICVSM